MLSNRKNHTSLELTLAADERKSKEYARLATEMKAKKKFTNPTSQLKKSATVEKHDSSLIIKSEKKGDSSEDFAWNFQGKMDIRRRVSMMRLNPLAISADVSKMFLSVGMAEQDQKWHRIHIEGNDYQFNNWPFGNAAGPFAALFTMAKLANNLGKSDLTKWIIENCLYMDDVWASVKTKQEAITIYEELIEVYDRALLLFRKWCTNGGMDHIGWWKKNTCGLNWWTR
jgi:hypothetical protein